MNRKHILPLLFIFPVLLVLTTAQPMMLVSASSSNDNEDAVDTSGQGNAGFAVGEQNPSDTTGAGSTSQACDPDDEECGTPPLPGPAPPGPPPGAPSGSNLAESNQVGGLGAGRINQQAQGSVNEQLCSTIGGIGNRQCAQTAPQGALQDCTAIAGLGKANCVQSENPDGSGTCLTANGRPFICETSTGRSLSGSGQAGQ